MDIKELSALILPSAVSPSINTFGLNVKLSRRRMKQTIHSVKRWRKSLPENVLILVGDNSVGGPDLCRSLNKLGLTNVYFFQVNPVDDEVFSRGGAGISECNTLMQILVQSNFSADEYIMKCNARYYIYNWRLLIDRLMSPSHFAAWPAQDLSHIETGFYVAKVGALLNGLPRIMEEVNEPEGVYVEHLYQKLVCPNLDQISFFQFAPAIKGVRGHTGRRENRMSESYWVYQTVRWRTLGVKIFQYLKN